MPVKLDNVGIAVRDLDAAIAFFTDLGLTVLGSTRISGEWADTAVGLDGNTADIAVLQTPDGNGRIEMFQYVHPDAIEVEPVQPNLYVAGRFGGAGMTRTVCQPSPSA